MTFHIKFDVPGDCIPKQRPRVTAHGTYYPARPPGSRRLSYPEYRELVQAKALSVPEWSWWSQRMDDKGHLHWGLSIKARLGRGDADNCLGSIMDALQGILWKDDAQILQATVTLERVGPRQRMGVEVEAWVLSFPP